MGSEPSLTATVVPPGIIKASLLRLFENRAESISYQWPMEHLTVQFHNHYCESIGAGMVLVPFDRPATVVN